MEVKELRDLIQEIHDGGDCGQALSYVLEMANKICEKPSDLEIVQKALDKSGSRLSIASGGEWIAEKDIDTVTGSGYDTESLLTWAKQQIGVES